MAEHHLQCHGAFSPLYPLGTSTNPAQCPQRSHRSVGRVEGDTHTEEEEEEEDEAEGVGSRTL